MQIAGLCLTEDSSSLEDWGEGQRSAPHSCMGQNSIGVWYLHFNMYVYSSKSACPIEHGGCFYNKGYVLSGSHWLSWPFVAKEGRSRSLLKMSLKSDQWHIAESWSFLPADLWGEEWILCWYSKLLPCSENLLHLFCLKILYFLLNKIKWILCSVYLFILEFPFWALTLFLQKYGSHGLFFCWISVVVMVMIHLL